MANDDWVNDVRRWYFGGTPPAADREADDLDDPAAIGYEAAYPAPRVHDKPKAADAPDESLS